MGWTDMGTSLGAMSCGDMGTWDGRGAPRLHVPKGHRCPLGVMGTWEGHGDTSRCHVHGDGTDRGTRDRQGDTMTPCHHGPSWGHGDMGWTRGHPDFMSSRATVGTQRDMGTPPSVSPRVPHVRGGGHGDKGGHGDIRDPCPRRMWGHGAMGTPRIHVPRGSPCPRGTWGRGASVSPGVLQCPHGIWGHRVPWGRLGSVSPKVLRCPRGTRGHPRSASPGVLCCPRGMRGHRVTWGPRIHGHEGSQRPPGTPQSQRPRGMRGHRVTRGHRLGSVSPLVLRCPRGTRGHHGSISARLLRRPQGTPGDTVHPCPQGLRVPVGSVSPRAPCPRGLCVPTGSVSPRDVRPSHIHVPRGCTATPSI